MPKNNNLEPVVLPMGLLFGRKPETRFKNNLESINMELLSAPTMDQLREYLPQFCEATWSPTPSWNDDLSIKEKDEIIKNAFFGMTLPTALETINLQFRISGISLQEVTHILRYRNASFSADCSGDKWWTYKDALVPNSIQNSNGDGYEIWCGKEMEEVPCDNNFYGRYKQIVEMSKQLYCDMIDSKKISIMDARYILPRCLETFYYMRITLKDALWFIKQRIDRQIQPETDNIMAYQMYCAILKQYPIANGLIDIEAPSSFYIKMARTGKATNLYYPEENSDKFDWNENDFIYQDYRHNLNGTDEDATNLFTEYLEGAKNQIRMLEKQNEEQLSREYLEEETNA